MFIYRLPKSLMILSLPFLVASIATAGTLSLFAQPLAANIAQPSFTPSPSRNTTVAHVPPQPIIPFPRTQLSAVQPLTNLGNPPIALISPNQISAAALPNVLFEDVQLAEMSARLGLSLDPTLCGEETELVVEQGADVVFCYFVTNHSDTTLMTHTVVDSRFGLLFANRPYSLFSDEAVLFTIIRPVEQSITNVMTWTGYISSTGPVDITNSIWATATSQVFVPQIDLQMTVGTDPSDCATTSTLDLMPNTIVYYCYTVTNWGEVPLVTHDLNDTIHGQILSNFYYELGPKDSTNLNAMHIVSAQEENGLQTISGVPVENLSTIVISNVVSHSTISDATWIAYTEGGVRAYATDSVQINVPEIKVEKWVGINGECTQDDRLDVAVTVDLAGNSVESLDAVYCYFVENVGGITLSHHTVVDSEFSTTIDRVLQPGESMGFTFDDTLVAQGTPSAAIGDITTVVTWTSYTDDNTFWSTSQDSVTVDIRIEELPGSLTTLFFEDINHNGKYDTLEPGMISVTMMLDNDSLVDVLAGTTDETGVVSFEELRGMYTIAVDETAIPDDYTHSTAHHANGTLPTQLAFGVDEHFTYAIGYSPPITRDYDLDGLSDLREGAGDCDRDNIPNFIDTDSCVFLPMIKD
ncbi:MAG: SdrD B-like domain-containing protein [Chloroflexota bacterium]